MGNAPKPAPYNIRGRDRHLFWLLLWIMASTVACQLLFKRPLIIYSMSMPAWFTLSVVGQFEAQAAGGAAALLFVLASANTVKAHRAALIALGCLQLPMAAVFVLEIAGASRTIVGNAESYHAIVNAALLLKAVTYTGVAACALAMAAGRCGPVLRTAAILCALCGLCSLLYMMFPIRIVMMLAHIPGIIIQHATVTQEALRFALGMAFAALSALFCGALAYAKPRKGKRCVGQPTDTAAAS